MLVADHELKLLIERPVSPLLEGFTTPADWFGKHSLVQPSSIDLHIGEICQPGIEPGNRGSALNPKSRLFLKIGQTAIVSTQETINMPPDYAGFGFPPSSVSSRALLMTNPGHIDPGYRGRLQFTVINMGKENYELKQGDEIVTLLIFRLSAPAQRDYAARNRQIKPTGIRQEDVDLLAADFVDVRKRAKQIAQKTIGYATAGASIATVILGLIVSRVDNHIEGLDQIKERLSVIETKNANLAVQLDQTRQQLEKQIEISDRLKALEIQQGSKAKLTTASKAATQGQPKPQKY